MAAFHSIPLDLTQVYDRLPALFAAQSEAEAVEAATEEVDKDFEPSGGKQHRGPCLQQMHEMRLSDPQGFKKLQMVRFVRLSVFVGIESVFIYKAT